MDLKAFKSLKRAQAFPYVGSFSSGASGNRSSHLRGTGWLVGSDERSCLGRLSPAGNCVLSIHLLQSLSHPPLGEKKSCSHDKCFSCYLLKPLCGPGGHFSPLLSHIHYGVLCYPLGGADIQPHSCSTPQLTLQSRCWLKTTWLYMLLKSGLEYQNPNYF